METEGHSETSAHLTATLQWNPENCYTVACSLISTFIAHCDCSMPNKHRPVLVTVDTDEVSASVSPPLPFPTSKMNVAREN